MNVNVHKAPDEYDVRRALAIVALGDQNTFAEMQWAGQILTQQVEYLQGEMDFM